MERIIRSVYQNVFARIKAAFDESMLVEGLMLFVTATILSAFSPLEGIAPFGTACAAAAWYAGLNPYFAGAGATLGYLISGNFAFALASTGYSVMAYLLQRQHKNVARVYRLLLLAAVEGVALLIFSLIGSISPMSALGSVAVSELAALVIGHGITGVRSMLGGRQLYDSELLTVSVLLGILTLSMGKFSILGQSPGVVFAGACVLIAAYRFGAAAVAVAVIAGAGRVLASGGDLLFIAVLSAVTLVAAAFRGLGKWCALSAFALTNVLFTVFIKGIGTFSYIEIALSALVFAAIPVKLYAGMGSNKRIFSKAAAAQPQYDTLQYRVSSLSEVLRELSRVYGDEDGHFMLCISDTLRRMLSESSNPSRHCIKAYTGFAECAKRGSDETGDSHTLKEIGSSLLMAISDGMGSGQAARRESAEALALLADLLAVGFSMEAATDCVNRLLMKRGGGDMYATLDAAMIDLSSGTVQLAKHGAPPSFILRNGRVHSLYAEALPIGIVEEARATARRVDVESGDTLIMMTDGVADALGRELVATIIDCVTDDDNAEYAAKSILNTAYERGFSDDMTVVIAKIA